MSSRTLPSKLRTGSMQLLPLFNKADINISKSLSPKNKFSSPSKNQIITNKRLSQLDKPKTPKKNSSSKKKSSKKKSSKKTRKNKTTKTNIRTKLFT